MIIRTNVKDWTRQQWLEDRRKSFGGSDVGAVLGLCPWRSPSAVWAEKAGIFTETEMQEPPMSEALRVGTDLEDYVASRFAEKTGKQVRNCHLLLRNTDYPQLHANIDRSVVGERACLECKTVNAMGRDRWENGAYPAHYYAQCVGEMMVGDYDRVYLAALIMGLSFKVYVFTRIKEDASQPPEWAEAVVYVPPEELAALDAATREAWKQVESGTMPPVDGSEDTRSVLDAVADRLAVETEEIQLDDMAMLLREREALKSNIAMDKARVDEIDAMVCQRMIRDDAAAFRATSGQYRITWKPQKRSSFDKEAFASDYPDIDLKAYYRSNESRVLRVTKMS